MTCHQCGNIIDLDTSSGPGRRDECRRCHSDLHACKNCAFYDPKAYNECREPQADRVQDKERSNFCDYFQPGTARQEKADRDKLFSAAEALFKKK